MQKSESIKSLAEALLTFHVKIDTINMDSKNPFFKSKYASLTNILETIKEPLIESGLVITQLPTNENGLVTMLIHAESGEWISSEYYMKPDKETPQGYGSVMTYQRRYCITSILSLNFDTDDDGTQASSENQNVHFSNKNENLPWLNKGTKQFDAAIEKLKAGTTTIEKIKSVMKLSKEVETLLKELSK